ncbi:MAG: hypothetical protein PVG33_01330 [Chloroflexota bacterium]|jgi:hypothetical protein
MKMKTLLLALLLLLAVAGCTGADDTGSALAATDEAQIYAAAIRQIYNVDHSFGEAPGWPLVYAVSVTDDSVMVDAPSAPSKTLAPTLQEAITAELADQPFELIWIKNRDEAPIDPGNGQVAEGEGIIITLGNIHPQEDGSVQLPFFMTCGGLCGIGKTYVLNQAGDAWQVTGSTGPEIIS